MIGRGDEAIVVAGRNVYPDDIETAVQHESIRKGCIAAVAAPDGGLAIVVEPSEEHDERRARDGVPRYPDSGRRSDGLPGCDGRVRASRVVAEDAEREAPPARDQRDRSPPATARSQGWTSDDRFDRRQSIAALLRAELAAVTGEPIEVFGDDALLSDVGLDSLSLIQALLSVREQILEDLGLSVDDVGDPPTLPWLETVGELIAFVCSSVPANVRKHGDE